MEQYLPFTAEELTAFMAVLWMWITPFILSLSVLIIFAHNTAKGRWNRRMSRASFLLILSYAILIDRVFLDVMGFTDHCIRHEPEWHWTTFYVFCTVYYGIALLIHHVVPFGVRIIRGHPPQSTQLDPIDTEGDIEHA